MSIRSNVAEFLADLRSGFVTGVSSFKLAREMREVNEQENDAVQCWQAAEIGGGSVTLGLYQNRDEAIDEFNRYFPHARLRYIDDERFIIVHGNDPADLSGS